MASRFTDLALRVRSDRRIHAAAGFVAAVLIIYILTDRPPPRRFGIPADGARRMADEVDAAHRDLAMLYGSQIDQLKDDGAKHQALIARLTKELGTNREQVSGILEALVDRQESLLREIEELKRAGTETFLDPPPPPPPPVPALVLEKFGEVAAEPGEPPSAPLFTKHVVISTGDTAEVELLSGVPAPVDGPPYPAIFRLTGPVIGPRGSTLDLADARLIAAAQGSRTDSRVVFRLTALALTHPDGRRETIKVDGWILGEDNTRGMKGALIDKLGGLIATTAGVSFGAALGERITSADGPQQRARDDFDYATTSALTDASNLLGRALLDHYQAHVPVVEISAARRGHAVFSQDAEISLTPEQIQHADAW